MKDNLFYKIISIIDFIVFKILFLPKIEGFENIPKNGAFILAGNHTKWLDPVMIVALVRRQLHFLAKIELFKFPLSLFMKGMGCIPVNRKVKNKDSMDVAIKTLEIGNVVAIFPEGTINRGKDLTLPFKMGAVSMAARANSLIIPFVITGKYRLFGGIKIKFLKPIKITGDLEKENKKFRNIINRCLEDEYENSKKR